MMRLLVISLAVFCFVEQLSAQISLPPVVVQSVHGNRVFLEINPGNLQVTLDSITSSLSSENFTWSSVLTNGASPGMDVNFFGYDALALGQVTTTGTFTGDSLVLAKDATIAGRLSVTDVSSFGDSLTVAGFVSLGDSLDVVGAVSIGEMLYVTGVTSLGDSLHVAGNVNMAQLLNVVGAATFESTVDVSGETTLNDTLHVNAVTLLNDSLHVVGGADFDASVNVDGNASVGGTLGVTGAASLSSTLAVTGVTSLSDSLHVADNADIDGTFNADGATTLGSTLTVSGITTLNDSLRVNSSVDVTGDFNLGGELQAAALRADSSIAQGGTASNYFTTALGSLSTASGVGAVAAGYTASAAGTQATAIGTLASASGVNAVAIGEGAQASAPQGVAVGKGAQATGYYANVAVGVNALVSAGWGNTAIGGGKVNSTTGAPSHSLALGSATVSSPGAYNVAIGYNSEISGNGTTGSMTFGPFSTINGGFRNLAMGYYASISGYSNSNYALGDYSSINNAWHAYALGNYSKVQANGHHGLAFGPYSEVSAFNAANFAYKTPARFSHEAIFGAYADTTQMMPGGSSHNDWIGTDPLFVIANGATEASRSNALIIRKDGAALFMDSLHVAGNVSFVQTLAVDSIKVTQVIDGQVANLDNHSTDNLAEGVTNQYFTNSRARAAFSAGTGVTLSNGELSIGQSVGVTDSVVFHQVDADGVDVAADLTVGGQVTITDSLVVAGHAGLAGDVSVSGILSASDLRHSSEVDIRVPDIGVTHFPWLRLHNDEGASRVYSQSDLWEVKAAEQIYIDLDGDNYLGMYENGAGLNFKWINQPGMATSHDLVDLKSNSGMTLRAGTGTKDVGIEMTNLNDIMVMYADTLFQPISEAMMIQIDSDESTDFHPVFGGQDHLYMTDDLAGNWSLFQHLTTYDELFDTGNAVSLFGSNDVLITADNAAGIEMSDHYRTAVIYGDSLSLKGDTRVHDDLRVDGSLVVNGQDLLAIIADLETRLAALEPQPWSCGSPVEDVDGNSYATVQIGEQCWLADNLRVHHYQNGDAVDYVTDNNTWLNASAGAYCYYDNDAATNSEHGVLYNWYAATDTRGLCPSGWHLPSEAEVLALSSGLGSGTEVGLALKSSASDTPPWDGENTSGFSSVPSGYRESFMSVYFTGSGLNNYLWTSTSVESWSAQVMRIQSNNYTNTIGAFRTTGASVRCLLD